MERIGSDEIAKWRVEIENAEDFREKNFGKFKFTEKTKAGENVDYFENGISGRYIDTLNEEEPLTTINIIYPIVKNVIPNLYYKNPYILSFPKRRIPEDEVSAPYAGAIMNYFHKELDIKSVNKQVVFDAYVFGMGICKLGYTTKFGTMPTEENIKQEQRERDKARTKTLLEKICLKKPPKEEEKPTQNPELNEYIRSESPYITWVNPFEFLIDPRATSIETAQWVAQKITKRLDDVKKNKTYKNTSTLKGTPQNESIVKDVPDTQIDAFRYIDLYEIHYKTDEGINILTLAKDGKRTEALRHDKSVYKMDGFQFEVLYFNKHNHKLYAKSDIDIVKGLQDRINLTLESILDQVDKYSPKLFVWEQKVTEQGQRALRDGDIGSIVYTNEPPDNVVKEGSFTQLKADLMVLIDKTLDIIMLETGLTKAQLMGLTSAETATEAQIGQAGQNLRLSDKFDAVTDFLRHQTRKFWQVVRQFVDLEQISLITGEQDVDPQTGMAKYSWMPDIDSAMSDRLAKAEYRFDIEMGSTEKPDLPILRKQIENLVNILGGEGVLQMIAMQGYKIELVEILREYLNLYPNMFRNQGRIIKPIQNPMQAGVMPQQPPQAGGGVGANPQQLQSRPPNTADIISQIGGEKGGNPPIA